MVKVTIPKINSAHGSDTRNIINRAIDSINIQGKSIQDLVAEGQLTPAQYAELIKTVNGFISKGDVSIHDINTNLGKIGLEHLSLEVKNMMTGTSPVLSEIAPLSVNNVHVSEKSISADKTDFITTGKNLFDSNNILSNHALNSNGGTSANEYMNTTNYYIPITPETDYFKSHEGQLVFYDSEKNLIIFRGQSTQGLITSPPDAYYARVSVEHRYLLLFQFEKGSTGTSYEPFRREIDKSIVKVGKGQVDNGALALSNIDGFKTGKNLINKANYIEGYYVSRNNGELVENELNTTTEVMYLEKGQTYTLSPKPVIGAINGVYRNEAGGYISGFQFTASSDDITIILPEGATSVQLSAENGISDRLQLEKGVNATSYEDYYFYHPGIIEPYSAGGSDTQSDSFLEVTKANDVKFFMPLSAEEYITFGFSNANTSDDFLKMRESAVYSRSNLSKLYSLTDDASNKEFAIRVDNGTEDEWFPEHNGIPTAFKGTTGFIKLIADGNEINLSEASGKINFKHAKMVQKIECKLPSDSKPRVLVTFISDIKDGVCNESVRFEFLQDSTVTTGYVGMVPMNTTEFVDNLLTNKFEYIKSKPDITEQLHTELNDINADEFYFTSDRVGKTDVLLKSTLIKSTVDLQRNWWQHRRGVNEKLYPTYYNNTARVAGDIDYFEFEYKIESVLKANEVYKLN